MYDALSDLVKAHKHIDQSMKCFQYMVNQPGKYDQQALDAVDSGEFQGVHFTDHRVKAINSKQFIQSLVNSLRSRMLNVASHRGMPSAMVDGNSAAYQKLIEQVQLMDSVYWPVDYDQIANFGETDITSLCQRLNIESNQSILGFGKFKVVGGRRSNGDLDEQSRAIACIPESTAECEGAFSTMNIILTKQRNRLEVGTLASLMYISILGPPIHMFSPIKYTAAWLKRGHHTAHDTFCRQTTARALCFLCPQSLFTLKTTVI